MYDNVLHGATGSNVDKIFYQLLHLIKFVRQAMCELWNNISEELERWSKWGAIKKKWGAIIIKNLIQADKWSSDFHVCFILTPILTLLGINRPE